MQFFEFNKDHGFLEGLIRGMRNHLLGRNDYGNISQSENLEDMKTALQTTEYYNCCAAISEKMSIQVLETMLQQNIYKEFQYIRCQSYEPLTSFLDYISYGYMIDNIALLISGIVNGHSMSELIKLCHPLGKFDRINAISICSSPSDLYNAILVDTPLARFFGSCVSEQDFDETHVVIIRNYVYREYMECFYEFIQSVGDLTSSIMIPILQFEADRRAFTITMNSLGTDLNKEERFKFFNSFGRLDHTSLAKLSKSDDFDQVKQVASLYDEYSEIFSAIDFLNKDKSIEDGFIEKEIEIHNKTFLYQFNFGVFYSYFRLKEQQIRNIIWIAECISQKNKTKIDDYLKI